MTGAKLFAILQSEVRQDDQVTEEMRLQYEKMMRGVRTRMAQGRQVGLQLSNKG